MHSLRYILKLSRPRFWIYCAGPYLLATIISGYSNIFSMKALLHFFYFLIFGNIFIYGVNDIFDKETDSKNPKKHSREEVVKEKTAFAAVMLSVLVSLIFLFFQQDWTARLFFLGFLFFSLEYSAPPIRFKSIPFLDSLSNVLYLFPGYLGYYHFTGNLPGLGVIILTIAWTSAMHLFSAIPDITYDRKAGISTTASLLGEKGSLGLTALYWTLFSVLLIATLPFEISWLSILYPLIPLTLILNPKKTGRVYWLFPYINLIFGAIFTMRFIYSQII